MALTENPLLGLKPLILWNGICFCRLAETKLLGQSKGHHSAGIQQHLPEWFKLN